jgi:sugar phosphate isomerase/epimerase
MDFVSRRNFLAGAGMVAAACATRPLVGMAAASQSPFKISVISDEISQDFDHACSVIANDFGLQWVELREMWGKNLQASSDAEIAEAQKILAKYKLQVTDIASPLFKVDWPGAPKSQYGSKDDMHGAAEVAYKHQDEVIERSISLAKQFKTDMMCLRTARRSTKSFALPRRSLASRDFFWFLRMSLHAIRRRDAKPPRSSPRSKLPILR